MPPSSYPIHADRIGWVDTAKGICIILVVMMHTTLGVGAAMGSEGFMHWVVAFAKPFRMPDFFMISGMFLARVINRDWRTYADKRVVHFLYFYVLWLVVQSMFKYVEIAHGDPVAFVRHLALGLIEPFSTLWFIYMLAIFSVVTKVLKDVPGPVLIVVAGAMQILHVETSCFLLDEFCERWVFFLVGYMYAGSIFRTARSAADRPSWTMAALGTWALTNAVFAWVPTGSSNYPALADLPVLSFLLGIAGALAIVCAASLVAEFRVGKALAYCGANSIAVYLAFFLPMAVTRTALIQSGLVTDVGMISLVTTVAAVLVPLALERLVRGTRAKFLFRRPELFKLKPVASGAAGLSHGANQS